MKKIKEFFTDKSTTNNKRNSVPSRQTSTREIPTPAKMNLYNYITQELPSILQAHRLGLEPFLNTDAKRLKSLPVALREEAIKLSKKLLEIETEARNVGDTTPELARKAALDKKENTNQKRRNTFDWSSKALPPESYFFQTKQTHAIIHTEDSQFFYNTREIRRLAISLIKKLQEVQKEFEAVYQEFTKNYHINETTFQQSLHAFGTKVIRIRSDLLIDIYNLQRNFITAADSKTNLLLDQFELGKNYELPPLSEMKLIMGTAKENIEAYLGNSKKINTKFIEHSANTKEKDWVVTIINQATHKFPVEAEDLIKQTDKEIFSAHCGYDNPHFNNRDAYHMYSEHYSNFLSEENTSKEMPIEISLFNCYALINILLGSIAKIQSYDLDKNKNEIEMQLALYPTLLVPTLKDIIICRNLLDDLKPEQQEEKESLTKFCQNLELTEKKLEKSLEILSPETVPAIPMHL